MQDSGERSENRRKAYLGVPVSDRDGRLLALRARQKSAVDSFGKRADVVMIRGAERVQVPPPRGVLPEEPGEAALAGVASHLQQQTVGSGIESQEERPAAGGE